MLVAYTLTDGRLEKLPSTTRPDLERAVWIDLLSPTPGENVAVATLAGIDVPSEADLSVLSDTDRLYRDSGNVYLEFTALHRSGGGYPAVADVGFILAGSRLITIRYSDPTPFTRFVTAYSRKACVAPSSLGIFVGLLENFVSRVGEYVEANSVELYAVSREVFASRKTVNTLSLEDKLERLGRTGDFNAMARDSLASINRLLAFVTEDLDAITDKATKNAFRAILRDVVSISDYANFVSSQLTFVLDAVLGLVTVDQNRIIKIFSVVATLFIPPTLFASVWGMNFKNMPELDWTYGYPIALVTIVLSAVLPYLFFRWRGWL